MTKATPLLDSPNGLDTDAIRAAAHAPAPAPPAFLTANALLAQARVSDEPVEVDGVGWVRLRHISKAENDRFMQDHKRRTPEGGWELDNSSYTKALLVAALVEPALARDQIEALWAGKEDVTDRLIAAVLKMNRMGPFTDLKTGEQTVASVAEPADSFRG